MSARNEALAVCSVDDLVYELGVCVSVRGEAVALFRVKEDIFAIGNHDPYCDASVLSRGLVGSATIGGEEVPYVASPLRKHRFELQTGRSLDDASVCVGSYAIEVRQGEVFVGSLTHFGETAA